MSGADPEQAPEDDEEDAEPPHEGEVEDEGEDEEQLGPVMTPFPGMGHDPIFGNANVLRTQAPRVLGELPGEVLLEVRGPSPKSGWASAAFVLACLLILAPCLQIPLFDAAPGLAREIYEQISETTYWVTLLGTVAAGVALLAWLGLTGLFQGAKVTVTSEGVALGAALEAAWFPWEQLSGYRSEGELFVLIATEGELTFLVTDEERAALRDLADQHGLERLT